MKQQRIPFLVAALLLTSFAASAEPIDDLIQAIQNRQSAAVNAANQLIQQQNLDPNDTTKATLSNLFKAAVSAADQLNPPYVAAEKTLNRYQNACMEFGSLMLRSESAVSGFKPTTVAEMLTYIQNFYGSDIQLATDLKNGKRPDINGYLDSLQTSVAIQ